MKKLGPPEQGLSNFRELTRAEQKISGYGAGVYVGFDRVTYRLYEHPSRGDRGFAPITYVPRELAEFWDK